MIIISHGRKDLIRKQKACIDFVNKGIINGQDPKEPELQEAVEDFQRWSGESKIFKDRDENSKGMRWVTGYEYKQMEKRNGETKTE